MVSRSACANSKTGITKDGSDSAISAACCSSTVRCEGARQIIPTASAPAAAAARASAAAVMPQILTLITARFYCRSRRPAGARIPNGARARRPPCLQGGKSGLRRAGCRVMPGRRKATESAAESRPPMARIARTGKGERVRQERTARPATGAARQTPSGARPNRGAAALLAQLRVGRLRASETAFPDAWSSTTESGLSARAPSVASWRRMRIY